MRTKDELLGHLRGLASFKAALATARDDAEKKEVEATTEQFVSSIADAVGRLHELAQSDPSFVQQLRLALVERHSVLTTRPTSGSMG